MSKLRLWLGLIALGAVGAVIYVRASNASDVPAAPAAASSSDCDSCCGPVVPEPSKAAVSPALPSPYSAAPDKNAAPAPEVAPAAAKS